LTSGIWSSAARLKLPFKQLSEKDQGGRSVWESRLADKNSLANCGLIAGFIEIVPRQRQGFWLDITLGLGRLWAQKTGSLIRPVDSQINLRRSDGHRLCGEVNHAP
jgi:hypothetical protein